MRPTVRQDSGRFRHKPLVVQMLESRRLLSADGLPQSARADIDTTYNLIEESVCRWISEPSDSTSLKVVLQQANAASGEIQTTAAPELGTNNTSLVELLLTARDAQDNELPVENGVTKVGLGLENSFFLEVAYSDLRPNLTDRGAFAIYADLQFDQAGLLPVLRETQRLVIGEELLTATSGTFVFQFEGAGTSVNVDLADFVTNPTQSIADSIIALGIPASDFEVTTFLPLGLDDFGYQIQFLGADYGNVNVPNLMVTPALDVTVPTMVTEFAPYLPDGVTPNSDAVRFNLDVRSRTFNGNDEFYSNVQRGQFNTATGFSDVGGAGRLITSSAGIRSLTNDGQFIEPFDVFRLEVYAPDELATPVAVDVSPSSGIDPILLYGINQAVPEDQVVLDSDANLLIQPLMNDPPTAVDDFLNVPQEQPVTLVVLANDLDPDPGAVLTVTEVTMPEHGTLQLVDGELIYQSNPDFIGGDGFSYTISDGEFTSTADVALFVSGGLGFDYGDSPLGYPALESEFGARHVALGPTLGVLRDIETNGQVSSDATGDRYDEDGIEFLFGGIEVGRSDNIALVEVSQAGVAGAHLDAWVDFNQDGDWADDGEQIAASYPVSDGQNALPFAAPATSLEGITYARFRLSTSGGLGVSGQANDGEVEDYAVAVRPFESAAGVSEITVADGQQSRSRVTSLEVRFDTLVDHATLQNAFSVHNATLGIDVGAVTPEATDSDGQTTVNLTFAGASTRLLATGESTLDDGNYLLSIDAANVRLANGRPMSDDVEFGSVPSDLFFRLFGDSDGDRDVDGQDYARFGSTFLSTIADNRYDAEMDSDLDGDIDGQDYARFGTNFLGVL